MRSESIPISKSRRPPGLVGLFLATFLRIGPIGRFVNFITSVRFVVRGDSMQPSFAMDQYILVSRVAYLRDEPSRGDVVVLRHPGQWGRNYIKRIVGLPGEHVQVEDGHAFVDGQLLAEPYLNGASDSLRGDVQQAAALRGIPCEGQGLPLECFLGDDQYFVMGDNRYNSDDSRSFGPLKRELIVGKAWIRYWPRSAWGFLP